MLDFPMHPNYAAQIPFPIASDLSLSESELNKEAPQFNYAIVGDLVGYFDMNNPAKLVVWTTLRDDSFQLPDPGCVTRTCGYDLPGGPVIPGGGPVIPGGGPVIPGGDPSCVGDSCTPICIECAPPPSSSVPEPSTGLLVLIVLCGLCIRGLRMRILGYLR